MSYVVRLVLIFGAWVLWVMPFFLFRPKKAEKAVEIRTEARWGIALESVGYFAIYLHTPAEWAKPLAPWRCAAGLVVAFVAIVLAWQSIRTLGRQ